MSKTGNSESGSIGENHHKSSAFGVSSPDNFFQIERPGAWYVAVLTHHKYMQRCRDYLTDREHPVYIAGREKKSVYANGTSRMVLDCVIKKYLFVYLESVDKAFRLVGECPFIDKFLPDRAKLRNPITNRIALATVPASSLEQLHAAIVRIDALDNIAFTEENLRTSDCIEAVRGHLKGISGGYLRRAGEHYLVITMGRLGNVTVRVPIEDCKIRKML